MKRSLLLGIAALALAATASCGSRDQPQIVPTNGVVTSRPPTRAEIAARPLAELSFGDARVVYGDKIGDAFYDRVYRDDGLEAIIESKNVEMQRKAAAIFAKNEKHLTAFILYDVADDRESMKQVAAQSYLSETPYWEFMLERAGVKVTPAQDTAKKFGLLDAQEVLNSTLPTAVEYTNAANQFFEEGKLDIALVAYQQIEDKDGAVKVAMAAEQRAKELVDDYYKAEAVAQVAIAAYRTVGDTPGIHRVASWEFVVCPQYGGRHLFNRELGIDPPKSLWEQRGQYFEQRDQCSNLALEAYARGGDVAGVERLLTCALAKAH